MALPIIGADERLAQRKGIKGVIFGRSGIGRGSQRNWSGGVGSAPKALTRWPASSGSNGSCIAEGRIR